MPKLALPGPNGFFVDGFLVSLLVVDLAEVGDKTQILTMIPAARFRQPTPIMFGIFVCHYRQPRCRWSRRYTVSAICSVVR
jgi:hypothetical protein